MAINISSLTLRDLEYLVALERHGHFGRAAASCHVSQPSLSAQIKKIEGYLGTTLFERSNRKVAITPAGKRVAAQARVVLDEARKIATVLGADARPLEGTLRLGAIATLGPFLIPRVLGPVRRAFPKLKLVFREGLTDELLAELGAGRLDAVLAARTFDETPFRVFPIFFEPFLLAAPAKHPLAAKAVPRVSDLRASEMVLLEDGHCLRDQALETCPANRRGHVREFHATGIETLRHLVAAGLGYTLLPKLATQGRPLKELIAYRELDRKVGREVVLVCRKTYPAQEELKLLAEVLSAAMRVN